ncbi:MAG: sugar phosphate isomerase/epimerase [Lentisphaerae bacterium]|nr:sugar phosphate isomerase/epimerase [Lentisphaerota bacterium]
MILGISTHWNTRRHSSGDDLVREILDLGVDHIEIGYDFTLDLVEGVARHCADGTVHVDSIHNYAPVPLGVPFGHPELFSLVSFDPTQQAAAIHYTIRTADLAVELGARFVVVHAGNISMRHRTRRLLDLWREKGPNSTAYDRARLKAITQREKKAPRHIDQLYRSLDSLLPAFAERGVKLALENLPAWESVPSELELVETLRRFHDPTLCCWHDMGHARVRQNLGFSAHLHWFERFAPRMAGMHVHDVRAPAFDHLAPSEGEIDFAAFKSLIPPGTIIVLEPAPGMPADLVQKGIAALQEAWTDDPPAPAGTDPAP